MKKPKTNRPLAGNRLVAREGPVFAKKKGFASVRRGGVRSAAGMKKTNNFYGKGKSGWKTKIIVKKTTNGDKNR